MNLSLKRHKYTLQVKGNILLREHGNSKQSHGSAAKKILFGLFLITISVSLGQLVLANYFSTKGQALHEVLQRKEALLQDNDILKGELAMITSISYVAKRAEELGFGKPQSVIFLPQDSDKKRVALDPNLSPREQ